MTHAKSIGTRARERRTELGLTLAEVAKRGSMSTGFLSDLEQGRSKVTSKINALAAALQVNAAWLETGRGLKTAEPVAMLGVAEGKAADDRLLVHGLLVSEEGCELAREWDKLPVDLRVTVRTLVELLVARHVRNTPELRGERRKKDRPSATA